MIKAGKGRKLANQPKAGAGDIRSPLAISGLIAWYDFSDPTAVIDSGGNLLGAIDKSPNGYDLSLYSPVSSYPYLDQIGARQAYYFYQDTRLEAYLGASGNFTMYAVAKYPSDYYFWSDASLIAETGGNLFFWGMHGGQYWDSTFQEGSKTFKDGGSPTPYAIGDQDHHIYTSQFSGSYIADLRIGGDWYDEYLGWDGQIGEVILYQGLHTASQVNKVGRYLGKGWARTWTNVSF